MAFDKRSDHRTKYEQATLFTSLPDEVESYLIRQIDSNLKSVFKQFERFKEKALEKSRNNLNQVGVYLRDIKYPIKHHIYEIQRAFNGLEVFSVDPYPNLIQDILKIFDDRVKLIVSEWHPKIIKAFEEEKHWLPEQDFENDLMEYIEQNVNGYRMDVEKLAIKLKRQKLNGGDMNGKNITNQIVNQIGNGNKASMSGISQRVGNDKPNILNLVSSLAKLFGWILVKVKTLFLA